MLRLVIIEGGGGQGHEGAGVFDGLLEEGGSEVIDDFLFGCLVHLLLLHVKKWLIGPGRDHKTMTMLYWTYAFVTGLFSVSWHEVQLLVDLPRVRGKVKYVQDVTLGSVPAEAKGIDHALCRSGILCQSQFEAAINSVSSVANLSLVDALRNQG
jgi:hypothetical protein